MKNPHIPERLAWTAGLLLCLWQVGQPAYYLTGDGPCHLYNARILHDLLLLHDQPFWEHYYTLLKQPNPNWLSHLLLAALLHFFTGPVAEKILLGGYVLLFTTGFARICRQGSTGPGYAPLAGFLFVFTHALAMGFYNFSIGVGFMLWQIAAWRAWQQRQNAGRLVFFTLLSLVTFFAHPVAFVFGAAACAGFVISIAFSKENTGRASLVRGSLILLLCLLPGMVFLLLFARGQASQGAFSFHPSFTRLKELIRADSLVNLSGREQIPASLAAMLIGLLLLAGAYFRVRKGFRIQPADAWLLPIVLSAVMYLCFPDKLFGGSLLVLRTQYLLLLFLTLYAGSLLPQGWLQATGGLLFFTLFIALSLIRISVRDKVSGILTDYLSVTRSIPPYSVLLPLDFAPGGPDNSKAPTADRTWLFCHASQYAGAGKPLIILDNYEANTGYFPLLWMYEVNPYLLLGPGGSIEALPPFGSLPGYFKKSGVKIGYVLTWCYDDKWLKDERFRSFYGPIQAGYHLVDSSPSGRCRLYQANDP